MSQNVHHCRLFLIIARVPFNGTNVHSGEHQWVKICCITQFGDNLHMHHFPAWVKGYSVTLVETIGDDTNDTSSHVWVIDLALGDVV